MTLNTSSYKLCLYSLILLYFACGTQLKAETMTFEVIPLQNSLLDDVLPVLQPLVANGGTVTGLNNQLVIRTTPSNMRELKQILASIDTPPRRLMISVKQDVSGNFTEKDRGISGQVGNDNITIRTPEDRRDGASVAIGDGRGNVLRYRSLTTKSDIDDRNTFRVQTIAGKPAFIQQGNSVPIANQRTFVNGAGIVVQNGIEYRDVTSGFYVLPRVNGDRVSLFISPNLNKLTPYGNGGFDIQNIETTANGVLGEWIQIGGISEQFRDKNTRHFSTTRSQGQESRSVLIKVDEIL